MKFSYALFNSALLASTALAAPRTKNGLPRRLQRRARAVRDRAMRSIDISNSESIIGVSTGATPDIVYSENWSGLAYPSPPSGGAFKAVSASFTVPTPSIPPGVAATNGQYSASAWVGIDGYSYTDAILQTGVDMTISTSGDVSFDAWYEWFPDYAYDFDLLISAGDQIHMLVKASTNTTGSATIQNLTTGRMATRYLNSTSALAGANAEWIVEDYAEGNALVALVDFGNATFADCKASTASSHVGVADATMLAILDRSGELVTNVTLVSDSSFETSYLSDADAAAAVARASRSRGGHAGKGKGEGNGRW